MIDFSDYTEAEARKLLTQPSFFVEEVLGQKPTDYQKSFLDGRGPGPQDRRIFIAGRQVGKSLAASWYAIWYAVTHSNSNVLILARAQRQALELFNTLKGELRNPGEGRSGIDWGIPRETRSEAEFANGSRILCLPVGNSGANIRGYSADLLMVDEAAFVADEIFQEVLSPMLAVGDNTFVMTSTPLGKQGYFYERYREAKESVEKGEEPDYNVTHAQTEENPYVDDSFIEEQRQALSPMQFQQEILGEFVEAADAYFTTEEVLHRNDYDVGGVDERISRDDGSKAYLGADIAHTGDDASVYISMDEHGNVFDVEYHQGKKLTEAARRIAELDAIHDYDKVVVDATGLGQGVVDMLEEDVGRKVEGFTFTGPKKADLYSTLKDAFQAKEIRFHYEKNLNEPENKMVTQLTALEYSYTQTGRMKIEHPSGGHDDFCDALALSNWARNNRPFTPSDRESMRLFNMGDLRSQNDNQRTSRGRSTRRNETNRRYR